MGVARGDFTVEIRVTTGGNVTSSVCNHQGRLVVWTTDSRDRDPIRPVQMAATRPRKTPTPLTALGRRTRRTHWRLRPGEYDVRRIVPDNGHTSWLRRATGKATTSRPLMITLAAVVVHAVAGSTWGYTALSKTVTLTLDGKSEQVSAFGGTVGDVLDAQGVELTGKDEVQPAVDQTITDGTRISVHFARPFEVSVDGKATTYWVTSTTVSRALDEIG